METEKIVNGGTVISVPTGSVKRVIEKICQSKNCVAEEVPLSERKRMLRTDNPDPDYTMIRVWHPPFIPIEEIMGGVLKRVI